MIGIYLVTSPTGKLYVGQSWEIEDRATAYSKHRCRNQRKLYASLEKYGWNAHSFQMLTELPNTTSQEILDRLERMYIRVYKDLEFEMMNIRDGGSGGKTSEETKVKLSEALKGRKYSPERCKNISEGKKGKLSEEARRKISEAVRGRVVSQETRMKMSESRKGVNLSEEHRKNISQSRKAIRFSEEHKKKISESKIGKKHSEEHKRKIGIGGKGKCDKIIFQYSKDNVFICKFKSLKDAAEHVKAHHGNISSAASGRRQYAAGYIWKYADQT